MRAFSFFAVLGSFAASVIACAGVADLDVKYNPDAGAPTTSDTPQRGDASLSPDASPVHATPVQVTPPTEQVLSTCAAGSGDGGCDTSAGFGCCLSGGATCMSQAEYATSCPAGGAFVGCFQPSADSECCWHDIDGRRVALPGSICAGGYACLADADCPQGTGNCATTTCHGLTIGQCGSAPVCP